MQTTETFHTIPAKMVHIWLDDNCLTWSDTDQYPLDDYNFSPDFGLVLAEDATSDMIIDEIKNTLLLNRYLRNKFEMFLDTSQLQQNQG